MRKMFKKAQRGFTLIELMIVVAIIGILAAVAIPMFLDAMKSSKYGEAKVQLAKIRDTAKTQFATGNGSYTVVSAATFAPTTDCCTQDTGGKKKCKGNTAADWAGEWQKIDFQMDDDFYFQYSYAATAPTFDAMAKADMDCDTTFVTFTQSGGKVNGNAEIGQLVEPPPNSD